MKDARNDRRIHPYGSDWMQMVATHHRGWQSDRQITQQLYKKTPWMKEETYAQHAPGVVLVISEAPHAHMTSVVMQRVP